jgi:Zn2+/Cd2+-exporting ATPase
VGDVADLILLSRATLVNIRQNVAGVSGFWPAVLADTGATVLVTLNALRLLGHRY